MIESYLTSHTQWIAQLASSESLTLGGYGPERFKNAGAVPNKRGISIKRRLLRRMLLPRRPALGACRHQPYEA